MAETKPPAPVIIKCSLVEPERALESIALRSLLADGWVCRVHFLAAEGEHRYLCLVMFPPTPAQPGPPVPLYTVLVLLAVEVAVLAAFVGAMATALRTLVLP